tara:strand:+ start:855 stop:1127 length:273 start_codon:yes stop_codon:yes gene_type:complete
MASNLENNTNLNSFFEEEYSSLRHYIKSKIIFGFGAGNSQSQNKKRFNVNPCSSMRKDFSHWKYYDEFWKNEGEQAYKNHVNRNHSIDNL